jgi:hypothetical protein
LQIATKGDSEWPLRFPGSIGQDAQNAAQESVFLPPNAITLQSEKTAAAKKAGLHR